MAAGETGQRAIPWRSSTFRVVLASTLVMPLGVRLLSPVLPLVVAEFGVTDVTASLIVSAYFLPGVVLSPVLGALADRVGRRGVLVPCLLVFGVTGGAIGLLDRFSSIVVFRLIQGTAAAGVFVVTVTLLADAYDGTQRNSALGINTSTLFVGAAVYPLLGGILALRGWNVPFFAYLLTVPICAFAYFGLDEAGGTGKRWFEYVRGAVDAIPVRRVLPLYAAAFAAEAISFGAILTALPFLLATTFRLGPIWIGVIVTAATVSGAGVASMAGPVAERVSDDRILALGFAGLGGGLVGIWLASDPLFVGVAAVIFGGGWGLVLPTVDVAISETAPTEFRAGALSLRNSSTFLGRTVGPVSFTGAAVGYGYQSVLLGTGLVTLAVGLTALVVIRGRNRAARTRGS